MAESRAVAGPVEPVIVTVRSQRVILSHDLARAYGVEPRALNQAVKRNLERFPVDFVFQLSKPEVQNLRSQAVISSSWGGRRYLPLAFTEHGAVAAAFVLNSPRAVEMSVFVVRAFLRLRQLVASQTELSRKLDELERRVSGHDSDLEQIVLAIRTLAAAPQAPRPRIGFKP